MRSLVTLPPALERTPTAVRSTTSVVDGDDLWFEVDAEHGVLVGDRADHVAVALLMPAMRSGRDLHVGGIVTDVLLHQLNDDAQALVRWIDAGCRRVRVSADAAEPARPAPSGVAAGFSGGVDSFAVLTEYTLAADVPEALRITHLLNNNVGAHGSGGRALWQRRCEGVRRVASDVGLPLVMVDSNLEAHYPRIGFMQSVTFRNASVAHFLSGGIGRLHYAAGFQYAHVGVLRSGDISALDPITLPLLSTPGLILASAGAGSSRVAKTLALVGRPEARFLDVCIDTDPTRTVNCSHCWKCMRTMLTLEIAGHLEEFCPQPFELEPYLARREDYIVELLASESPLSREVVDFAAERGWSWSRRTRARAGVRRVREASVRGARDWRHRLRRARTA
ncbi:hypothetical protein SAMN04487846_0516 [Microbacterium sp. cf046]|uniref:hypothetical protein n=1 Tax=Microbacterium sp. cf046 TaxID=1761803 RepID=UPI0008E36A26|nr:hypothetical protein [Microbacterium sp. cf046]SFR91103.1 hypothetical protein SAMN04487846_0516 [Microbacterium sp. cf046]